MPAEKKARERWFLDAFREQLPDFPDGQIEASEKPDFLVAGRFRTIGFEVTSLHQESGSASFGPKQEAEQKTIVQKAQEMYEQVNTTPVWVHVYFSHHAVFNRQNRSRFTRALADLVMANVPNDDALVQLDNPYNDLERFPIEFDRIEIERRAVVTKNFWSSPSGGIVGEHFVPLLQTAISAKETSLLGYNTACSEQWLLVVMEGMTPSTLFDPSKSTLDHLYSSSFGRVFLLDAFRCKQWELRVAHHSPPNPPAR